MKLDCSSHKKVGSWPLTNPTVQLASKSSLIVSVNVLAGTFFLVYFPQSTWLCVSMCVSMCVASAFLWVHCLTSGADELIAAGDLLLEQLNRWFPLASGQVICITWGEQVIFYSKWYIASADEQVISCFSRWTGDSYNRWLSTCLNIFTLVATGSVASKV